MSLSDLAAIGSFVSGIAVVISLVTLTIQIRQNTNLMRRAEANAQQEQFSQWRLTIAGNAELANIWVNGMRDGKLTEVEEQRFSFLLQDFLFCFYQSWDREKTAMKDREWDEMSRRIAFIMTTKRGAAWWERNRFMYLSTYAEEIDAAVSKRLEASRQAASP
jgi:hypothetical protein